MKNKITGLLVLLVLSVVWLGGAAFAGNETGYIRDSQELIDKIQQSIEKMLQPPTHEISIHALLETGAARRIASTTLKKKGTPSEPEDVEAILLNKTIYIHEGDIYDITTPLHDKKGKPFAVAGIKVKLIEEQVSKNIAKAIAQDLSRRIEAEILSFL